MEIGIVDDEEEPAAPVPAAVAFGGKPALLIKVGED
jgi:hypothetical protein